MIKILLLVFSFLIFLNNNSRADNPSDDDIQTNTDSSDVLTAFSAKIKDKTIFLNWKITNLQKISYFEIQRHDANKKIFETINKKNPVKKNDFVDKSIDDANISTYNYTYEDEPQRDGVFFYRLKAFSDSKEVIFISDEIKIGISGLRDFILEQNKPNPFNPITSITYELFSDGYVQLKVFDLIGKEVASLVDQNQTEGKYTVQFDASIYSNLTSGIYFYVLKTDKYSDVKKMILTK